jgi:flagellar basal body rod protein FlgG
MDARLRLTFFCGSCLGLAVGFAAGHVSVWQRGVTSRSVGLPYYEVGEPRDSASLGSAGFDFPAVLPHPEVIDRTPVPGGAVVLNDPDLGDEPVHADALVEWPARLDPIQPLSPPHSFPLSQAKPLTPPVPSAPVGPRPTPSQHRQAQAVSSDLAPLDPEVVEMLKDELHGVSEQQREVWSEALRGMSPGDAAGVILMWKKFGQKGAGADHLSSPPPMFDSSHPEDAPARLRHLAPHPTVGVDLGLQIALHNQANRETCGYLEMVPLFQEVAFDPVEGHEHVRIIGSRLKIQPGRLVETGNPAHVAVQRECFFAVKLPTGEEQYTRVGRLVLDAERRLCIDLGDRDLPITPEIKMPEGATRFTVQNGHLHISVEGQAEPASVGPLQVAEFFDASRLLPLGGSLYGATTASGKPNMVAAELVLQSLEYPLIEGVSDLGAAIPNESAPRAAAR